MQQCLDRKEEAQLLDQNHPGLLDDLVTLDNSVQIAWPRVGDESFKWLTYQLSMVGNTPTMVITGNGESGFDSGEGALEMATTSKEGSRRANYPIPTRGGSDEK